MSQTIDEIRERIRLKVRRRNLKLMPDLDEANGSVTQAAFQVSERLAGNIQQLVDTGRLSKVTGQADHLTPSSTLSVRDFLNVHDQYFVDFTYSSILGRSPDAAGREYYLKQFRQGEYKCSVLMRLYCSSEGRARAVKTEGLVLHLILRERWPFQN